MEYKRWLGKIAGISAGKKIALEELAGDARAVYRMDKKYLQKINFLTEKEREMLIKGKEENPEK